MNTIHIESWCIKQHIRINFENNMWVFCFEFYLPTTIVTVKSFEDTVSWASIKWSPSTELLIEVNVGCLGTGSVGVSFSSISTTDAIVGLYIAESCTHSIPTCMHLNTWFWELESRIFGSTRSIALPSFQRFHAWNNSKFSFYSHKPLITNYENHMQ